MKAGKNFWNGRYLDADTPWDKGSAAPAIERLLEIGVIPKSGKVFVPGCGTGHDVAEFARLGFDVTGLDIAPLAIEEAMEKYGDLERANFELGDLFDEKLTPEIYDIVWEHTCLCALEPSMREDYVDAVARLLKPNGLLVGAFFTDTQMPEGEGPPFQTSRDEVVELFSAQFDLVQEMEPPAFYPDREGREWVMSWRKLD